MLRVLHSIKGGVGQAVFSSEGSTGEESGSNLIQVVGRIHFFEAIKLMVACFLKDSRRMSPPSRKV